MPLSVHQHIRTEEELRAYNNMQIRQIQELKRVSEVDGRVDGPAAERFWVELLAAPVSKICRIIPVDVFESQYSNFRELRLIPAIHQTKWLSDEREPGGGLNRVIGMLRTEDPQIQCIGNHVRIDLQIFFKNEEMDGKGIPYVDPLTIEYQEPQCEEAGSGI